MGNKERKLILAVQQENLPEVKRLIAQGAKPDLSVGVLQKGYCHTCIVDPDSICEEDVVSCMYALLCLSTCCLGTIAHFIVALSLSGSYSPPLRLNAFEEAFKKALSGKMDVFRYFVKECKLSPNHSHLLRAIEKSGPEAYALKLVKLIMEEGKVTATTDPASGLNPLYAACLYSSSEIVQYLMDKHQHPYVPIASEGHEYTGLTPMDAAVQRCCKSNSTEAPKIVRYLITQKNINPHTPTKDHITPLERAEITAPTLAKQMRQWWESAQASLAPATSSTLFTGSYCPVYAENPRAYLAPPSSPVPGW